MTLAVLSIWDRWSSGCSLGPSWKERQEGLDGQPDTFQERAFLSPRHVASVRAPERQQVQEVR